MSSRQAGLGRVVDVRGAGVEGVRVGDELDVADAEDHVQLDALAGGLEELGGFFLRGRERGDDAEVREALETAHVVRIPLAVDALLALGVRRVRRLQVEDGAADVRLLAGRDLPLPVEVPDRLGQELRDVRSLGLQDVPDVVDGGYV